jgi:hypothetical protein
MFVDCNTPPKPETIILRKLDDKTVLLQKPKNRNFSDPGEQLSYCGPATQAMYEQQKGKKITEHPDCCPQTHPRSAYWIGRLKLPALPGAS